MSEKINIEKAFEVGRDIKNYFEIWETARNRTDPLIEKWKEYIEKKGNK